MNTDKCKVCNNASGNKVVTAREKMYKSNENFDYLECGRCGCLQIKKIPDNISKYYPADYYSFESPRDSFKLNFSTFFTKKIIQYRFGKNSPAGYLFSKLYYSYHHFHYLYWLKKGVCSFNSKILDVGCGSGDLLFRMRKLGFKNLKGVDLYIPAEIVFDNNIKIEKKQIDDLDETFDFIMLHHSFEHMDNPREVFENIHKRLNPGGYVLIRIPIVPSCAYEKYGINWVQFDAPRHFLIHSVNSMQYLAKEFGFELRDIVYDTTAFSFIGSEKYRRGYGLYDDVKFTGQEQKLFLKEALDANAASKGDQACFYFYKNPDTLHDKNKLT